MKTCAGEGIQTSMYLHHSLYILDGVTHLKMWKVPGI